MTGDSKTSTFKNGDDWGMVQVALFQPHDNHERLRPLWRKNDI